ncbi:unnamed protein product [Acanthoscelides obtectus]|uniref:Uncharacterized protein n=1 Tax=Acanthoscelides obtectus TaxID=200917 RepID=A0A9P0Q0S5_ACAOB|nr:unnamed protein product [Acanthoscelides obtectus]CAK1679584.1 hypothetical protein AOBTE_LOCUS32368 [Acanthoscelides obtectus]
MGRVTKKVTRKHRKKLQKLLQLLDSSSESLESTGTDSDSDAPLSKHPTQVPEPGSSQDQGVQNILQFLGNQASAKGPEVSTDVAALISEFLLKGIDKESRKTTLESYPCLANCPALQPPVINPEVGSCLSTDADKEDTFLSKLQLQLASGISALAVGFDNQYEITKSNSTDETRADLERWCAPLKIIADVFHAISLHRYSILPFLDGNVRKFSDTCPIDEFLFGKTFPDQWKSASEAQRLGFSIKKKKKALGSASSKPVVYKKLEPKPGPSRVSSSLNSRRHFNTVV